MTIIQAIVLGAVQGITEFLPISSSGHLILVPHLLHWPQQSLDFDLVVHLATLLAVIIALNTDIRWLLQGWSQGDRQRRALLGKLFVATLPALATGLLFSGWLANHRTLPIVAWSLIIWGLLLAVADKYSVLRGGFISQLEKTQWGQALAVGCLQIFAFIPGTSRSGTTMTAGLFAGLDRQTAAKFSFLLSLPITAAAGAKSALDMFRFGLQEPAVALLIGFVTALAFGVLAIKLLLRVVSQTSFLWFAGYRVILGVSLLMLFT